MSNSEVSKLGDYELLAVRSDGFIDAQRGTDQLRVLIRKVEGADSNDARAKLQLEADRRRAAALRGPAALSLVDAFQAEGAFVFVFSFFAGRRATVQLLRGRTFSFEEAMRIGLTLAKLLSANNTAHGSLGLANLLIDDSGDVRLVPVLPIEGGGNPPKATFHGDMRQLALLIGHLAFGAPQAAPDAEPRVLARWILQPEVPVRFRTVLQSMLGPAGPYYSSWRDCVRDLERAIGGVSASEKGRLRGAAGALAGAAALVAAVGVGAWGWWHHSRPKETTLVAPSQVAYQPAAVDSEETPEVADTPSAAPAPSMPEAKPAVALAEDASWIEYTRVVGGALARCESCDFAGALAELERWSSENPEHLYGEAAGRQIERIRLAQATFNTVGELGNRARGAQLELADQTRGALTKMEGGQVTVAVRTQFGSVEKIVELSTLPPASIAAMLAQADAQSGSTHAPTFLLGSNRFEEARALLSADKPEHQPLFTWADDWKKLTRDREALLGLDKVTALIATGEPKEALAEFERVTTQYRDTEVVTNAMKEDISRLQERLASLMKPGSGIMAKTASAGYPGLPVLSLAPAVPKGDPEYQKVVDAVQWLVQNGGWEQHREAVDQALAAAAKLGVWNQHPKNLERILTQKAPSLMLAHATVLQSLPPAVLDRLSKDEYNREFLSWLFTNPRAMQLLAGTLKPQDKPERVIEIWRECWMDDKQSGETYMALALAVAVVFDQEITVIPEYYGYNSYSSSSEGSGSLPQIAGIERYRFFRDCAKRGALRVPLAEMQPHELIWVVDSPVPNAELEWAQKHVNLSRRNWGDAYGMIRYRMDKAAGGRQIYERYTLAQIKNEGGICGDQAYFAAQSAKANGIPAMVIGGEGERGGHAWFGYQASRDKWNLEAGRFTSDNYAAGTSQDPQTHRTIKEHELQQFATPERRTAGWAVTERYLQLSELFSRTKQPDLARTSLDLALRTTPKHLNAWNLKLDNLVAAKVSSEEWQREIAQMRTVFQKYPDIISGINERETAYLVSNGDAKLALKGAQRGTDRLLRKQGNRTDLILESIDKEVALAEKSDDPELPGRIFREALKDKGSEVVAFKQLAPRYYEWARKKNQGRDALRDIERAFNRNFDMPSDDYFRLGAYRDLLGLVTDLFKKEGLEADVRRLERRAAKVDELRKDIGARSRRAERG